VCEQNQGVGTPLREAAHAPEVVRTASSRDLQERGARHHVVKKRSAERSGDRGAREPRAEFASYTHRRHRFAALDDMHARCAAYERGTEREEGIDFRAKLDSRPTIVRGSPAISLSRPRQPDAQARRGRYMAIPRSLPWAESVEEHEAGDARRSMT